MAIVSRGYDGTITEADWALLAPGLGAYESVTSGLGATVLTSPDRAVRIAGGAAVGHGVLDVSDTAVTVACGSVASGVRWDTVALRRNWATNTTSIVVVAGTATTMVAPGVQANPGVSDDQPLYLAKVQAGSSVIVELVDVRVRASKALTVSDLVGLPSAPEGTVAFVGDRLYRRVADAAGVLSWTGGVDPVPITVNPNSGWRAFSVAYPPAYQVSSSGWMSLTGVVGRSNSLTLPSGGTSTVWGGIPLRVRPSTSRYFPVTRLNEEVDMLYIPESASLRLRNREISSRTYTSTWWVSLDGIGWQL